MGTFDFVNLADLFFHKKKTLHYPKVKVQRLQNFVTFLGLNIAEKDGSVMSLQVKVIF